MPVEVKGKTIVLTGTFTALKREEAEQRLAALGARVVSSLSSKTDILFAGAKAGSKLEKARGLGVQILDEAALLEVLGQAPGATPAGPTAPPPAPARAPARKAAAGKGPGGISGKLWAAFLDRHPDAEPAELAALQSWLGRPLPADLRAIGRAPSGSIFLPPLAELLAGDGNSFQRVLEQAAVAPEPLRQIFTGCFYLGELEGDGDCFFAYVPLGLEEETCLVTVWSHETGQFGPPVAEDLASFEEAWAICQAEALDPAEARRRLAPLKGRIYQRWPFNSEAFPGTPHLRGFFGKEPRKNSLVFLQDRAEWLVQLLRGHKLHPQLWPTRQLSLDLDPAINHRDFARRPASALYCLWRSYFLGEEQRLDQVLGRLEGTPSRLLSDAAALVRELRSGRKQLGRIEDVPALRAWLIEMVTDPAKAEAALKEAAHQQRESALHEGLARGGLRARPAPLPPGLRPLGMRGHDGRWPLPGGGEVILTYQAVEVAPEGGGAARRLDCPVAGNVRGLWPAPDGTHLLVSYFNCLCRVPLAGGPLQVAWSANLDDVAYVSEGRALAISSHGDLLLLEPRGSQLVPASHHRVLGARVVALLDGRVALACPGSAPGAAGFTVVGLYPGGLQELLRVESPLWAVAAAGDCIYLGLDEEHWYQLEGLEEAWAAARPASTPPPLPEHEAYRKLSSDPRPTDRPTDADRARFPQAVHLLRADEITFAVVPEGSGFVLAWEHRGELRNTPLPELQQGYSWCDGQLQVVVSPRRDHALVFRHDLSVLNEVDLSSGAQDLTRSDDPASGSIHGAGYLSDDVYAWAHWRCRVHRRGQEEQLLWMNPRYTSVAGMPLDDGKHAFAGVKKADASGPQHLEVLEIEGLDGGELKFSWRPIYSLGSRLATVVRHQDQILVLAGGEVYQLALAGPGKSLSRPPGPRQDGP